MELLRHLTTEQGKTAVVVTHDPRIAAEDCLFYAVICREADHAG